MTHIPILTNFVKNDGHTYPTAMHVLIPKQNFKNN